MIEQCNFKSTKYTCTHTHITNSLTHTHSPAIPDFEPRIYYMLERCFITKTHSHCFQ